MIWLSVDFPEIMIPIAFLPTFPKRLLFFNGIPLSIDIVKGCVKFKIAVSIVDAVLMVHLWGSLGSDLHSSFINAFSAKLYFLVYVGDKHGVKRMFLDKVLGEVLVLISLV